MSDAKVQLISVTEDPEKVIYAAFRNCYSNTPPSELWDELLSNKIKRATVEDFNAEKLATGHNSPLRLVNFVFIVDNVSRAMTAQFNRHVIGIGREEVSQRYVDFSKGLKQILTPPSFKKHEDSETILKSWEELQNRISEFYNYTIDQGIPKEDARFALPMGTTSREIVSFTFEALQHFVDIRTCDRAQWEIRDVAIKLQREIKAHYPNLAGALGVKCMAHRLGHCNEALSSYNQCAKSKIRPHKDILEVLWKQYKRQEQIEDMTNS